MKARIVQFVVTVSGLFLLAGLQSARAGDEVHAIAVVVEPFNNQHFTVGTPSTAATVPAAAGFRAIYTNKDASGTPDKSVRIQCTYTLTHSTLVGTPVSATSDDTFTIPAGTSQEVQKDLTASGDFYPEGYQTRGDVSMTAITAPTTYHTTGSDSTNWVVNVIGSAPPDPPGGGSCRAKKATPKKSLRQRPSVSHKAHWSTSRFVEEPWRPRLKSRSPSR